ncbi:hypothetical protein GQ600_21268 [Phytophthora cactorum]|nr:hypothetical protein GQ600_21268 [Phytophthora cactorum]
MLQTIRSDKQGDASDATRAEYVLREFDSQEEGTRLLGWEAVPCVSGCGVGGHSPRYQLKLVQALQLRCH